MAQDVARRFRPDLSTRRERAHPLVLAGVGAVAASVAALLALAGDSVFLPLIYTAAAGLMLLARRRLAPAPLSPIWMVTAIVVIAGILGQLFAAPLAGAGGASVVIVLPPDVAHQTGLLFGVVALVVAAAGVAVAARKTEPVVIDRQAGGLQLPARARPWLWLFALVPAALFVAAGDLGRLVERASYQPPDPSEIAALGGQAAAVAAAVLGLLWATSRPVGRIAVAVLLGIYATYSFAIGSRRLALVLPLFALGYYLAKMNKRAAVFLGLSVLAALVLAGIPLYMRELPTHGIVPYAAALPGYFASPSGWRTIANNLLVSFPIAGAVAFAEPPIPGHVLWTQLNPAPGSWTDWPYWAPQLRLNFYTPYSAIGELGNYGWTTLICVTAAIGATLGYLDRRVRAWSARGQHVVVFALVGLSALFAIFCLQYDLRAALRMLVYAVALDVLGRLFLTRRSASCPAGHRS